MPRRWPPALRQTSALSLFGQRVREQRTREGPPGAVRIRSQGFGEQVEERCAPACRVEITGEREHGGVVESRVPVWIAAGSVHEQGAADRRVALLAAQRDLGSGAKSGDDELDVVSRSGTRLRSSRA
jgi:hypothetical protein